jgi:hypothetical protein
MIRKVPEAGYIRYRIHQPPECGEIRKHSTDVHTFSGRIKGLSMAPYEPGSSSKHVEKAHMSDKEDFR